MVKYSILAYLRYFFILTFPLCVCVSMNDCSKTVVYLT